MVKKDLKKFQDQTKLSTQNYLTAEAVAGELLSLYEVDFAAWVDTQALLLEQGRYEKLDKANLIEEIRDLSRRERSALNNNLRIVLLHLLKWQFQSDCRSRSWKSSIVEHRQRIEQSLEESPSLKTYLENVFKDVYFRAVKKAEIETGLNRNTFPVDCPYTLAEILDVDFMPVETND